MRVVEQGEYTSELVKRLVVGDELEVIGDFMPVPAETTVCLDDSGEPMAAFGFVQLWGDHAQVFASYSEEGMATKESRAFIVKSLTEHLLAGLEKHKFRRLQFIARAGNPFTRKFAKLIGFEEEGVLRRYMNGEDFIMFSRIRS